MVSLLIVTVNYRTADLAITCLQSVAEERLGLPNLRMVIVDNDSGDGSFEKIAAAIESKGWGEWASIVAAGRNGGFSFGNNVAIRPALESDNPPDFIWLLNPDAKLFHGAGKALLAFMSANPKAGLATSSSVDDTGEAQPMAFHKFTAWGEFLLAMKLGYLDRLSPKSVIAIPPGDAPYQADWLSGSSLMIRREVFDDIGLMDEAYFLYFEESDFCLQAQRKGWELWYVPQSRIFHIIGASTGFTRYTQKPPRRKSYWFYSRRRYFVKNYGVLYAGLADFLHMAGYVLWRARRALQHKPDFDPPKYLFDFFLNSVLIKGSHL
jgi:GT2 family glycosyltransferase